MRLLIVLQLILLSALSNANDSTGLIPYTGQGNDEIALSRIDVVTTYKEVPYEGTCYRDVPRTVQKCGNRSYSRRVCRTIPGRNVCRDVRDTVCRNVTKYKRRCTTGASKQICSTSPTRNVCTTRNGKRVCNQVGGKRTCRTVPGKQTCNSVPYSARECTPTSRNVCSWKPSYQDCHNQPYTKYECWNTTVIDQVAYSCTKYKQVPQYHDVETKAEVLITFRGKTDKSFDLNITLNKNGSVDLVANGNATSDTIVIDNSLKSNDGDIIIHSITIGIIKSEKLEVDNSYKILSVNLNKKSEILSVALNKVLQDHSTLDISAKLTKKNKTKLVSHVDLKANGSIKGSKISAKLLNLDKKLRGKHDLDIIIKRNFDKVIISNNKPVLKVVLSKSDIKATHTK